MPDDDLNLHDDDQFDDDDSLDDLGVDGDYKHKYEVLQGKYNAELGRANEMLSNVLKENAALNAKASGGNSTTTFEDDSAGFDDDIANLEEHFPVVARGMRAIIAAELPKMVQPTTQKVEELTKETAKIAHSTMESRMDGVIPEWRKLNHDEDFIKWVKQPDRYAGVPKQTLLWNAFQSGDTERASAFFEDYMSEKGQDRSGGKKDNVAPNTGGGSLPAREAGGGTLTRSDIAKFYSDRANNRFTGSEEEAAKYEARILRAVREGKVRS